MLVIRILPCKAKRHNLLTLQHFGFVLQYTYIYIYIYIIIISYIRVLAVVWCCSTKTTDLPQDVVHVLVYLEDFLHYSSLPRKVGNIL